LECGDSSPLCFIIRGTGKQIDWLAALLYHPRYWKTNRLAIPQTGSANDHLTASLDNTDSRQLTRCKLQVIRCKRFAATNSR
jgi:hypothetical protein